MIAAICARADVWLRRAVRMAGEVTDRALRIPYVKGTVAFRQYFSPSSLCRPVVSPRERSEGVRPASLARIFLITVQLASRGITQRTATRIGRAAAFATRSEPAYLSGLRAATALAAQKNSRRVRAGIRRA
jgi:hypothetical protein